MSRNSAKRRRESGENSSHTMQTIPLENHAKKLLEDKKKSIAAVKPNDWIQHSLKYRSSFQRLLQVWEDNPQSLTILNGNGVCFEEEFFVGGGSYGTEVYVCLGTDGIERAVKRLPKRLGKQLLINLKNERDILTSPNAVESPRIVNYWFYDDTSSPDFCYLILNLHEQNLEEYIRENGAAITESRAREMIRQVLEGLKALHAREPRILHRDLKPTNILVDINENIALSDFGIGRFFAEGNYALCMSDFPYHYPKFV